MMKYNPEDFKFSMPVQMRWNDMDALGHINNIYYFEYFQIGRAHYMPAVSKTWDWQKNMFVIAHIECDYFKEMNLLNKNPILKMRTSRIGHKSFDFEYIIVSEAKDGSEILHAKGMSTMVLIDMQAQKSTEMPEWLIEELREYEPGLKD